MPHSPVPVLFESTGNHAVQNDPANDDWILLLCAIAGPFFETLARRYYIALYHFRRHQRRPPLSGQPEVQAQGKQQALLGMLQLWEQRKARRKGSEDEHSPDVFLETSPEDNDQDLPEALRDFSKTPPPWSVILAGPGRPPSDAMCLLRAFLAAPLLGVGDDPTSVHRLLRSNPAFASQCGFLGRDAVKQPGEFTSRRLPSLSVCEEFNKS